MIFFSKWIWLGILGLCFLAIPAYFLVVRISEHNKDGGILSGNRGTTLETKPVIVQQLEKDLESLLDTIRHQENVKLLESKSYSDQFSEVQFDAYPVFINFTDHFNVYDKKLRKFIKWSDGLDNPLLTPPQSELFYGKYYVSKFRFNPVLHILVKTPSQIKEQPDGLQNLHKDISSLLESIIKNFQKECTYKLPSFIINLDQFRKWKDNDVDCNGVNFTGEEFVLRCQKGVCECVFKLATNLFVLNVNEPEDE